MMELLARVNDKTENPDRPWVVKEVRNGKEQWIYYCNTDWYHEMFRDRHPVQQHNISVSGGTKNVRYFISGGYDRQTGIMKAAEPDVFQKYNLRAKIDAKLNKIMSLSNNTSFYNSNYSWIGVGDIQDVFRNLRHTPASFPLFNPDGPAFTTTLSSSAVTIMWPMVGRLYLRWASTRTMTRNSTSPIPRSLSSSQWTISM